MAAIDWLVLGGTILCIVAYGLWKGRGVRTAEAYLPGGADMKWHTVGLSIMATQASAITFLSLPGQAYEDGLGFVQLYFGLPIAMVILSALVLPVHYRLRVRTAYEYLEHRFDKKTRQLTALLFLLQRGLGAGLSIFAPAIILSAVLGWPLQLTNVLIGALVTVYTFSGGTRAVSRTQTYQMMIMLGGMALALALLFTLRALPEEASFSEALHLAGALGKTRAVDCSLRLDTRYTIWSGLAGGLFVALAYFGTDQSQVQRYLTGESLTQSRLGLLLNGLVKIPMQLFILLVGLMVFVFYQFQAPPVFFHGAELARARETVLGGELQAVEAAHGRAFVERRQAAADFLAARAAADRGREEEARQRLRAADSALQRHRGEAKCLIARALPGVETRDADYIFISFVTAHFPRGLLGLLLAVILCAAMSATASALNALGATTAVDLSAPSGPKPAMSTACWRRRSRR